MSHDVTESESRSKKTEGAAAFGRKAVRLTLEGGRVFLVDKERLVLGSVVSADIRLSGDGVAPIHAVIEVTESGERSVIYDLASESGVYVNDEKAVTKTLKSGDRITIGRNRLVFQLEDLQAIGPKELFKESGGRKLFLNPGEDFTSLLLEDEGVVEEIFDYRPTSKQALEVVMSWSDTILDVEHFVDEKAVTLGQSRTSDFGIPPLLNARQHQLVTRSGETFSLNFDPQMSGVIQRKGQLLNLAELKQGQTFALEKDDFAKVDVGDITFYVSFTAAPPRLRRNRFFERDPLFFKIYFTSLLLTAMTVSLLLNINVPPNLEAEQLPERIATILYQPEKFLPKPEPIQRSELVDQTPIKKVEHTPKPPKRIERPKPEPTKTVKVELTPRPVKTLKPVPKEMDMTKKPQKAPDRPKPVAVTKPAGSKLSQNAAKEGEGARAKGTEGTRGSKNAAKVPNTGPQNAAYRPSPQGGKGRGGGNSRVQDIGNVDFLNSAGAKIENILGNTAAKLGKGGEKLKGFGGFDTAGNGGLGLSGSGRGGGGDADSLGGLGNKGRGGGRVGTGLGAAGNGTGIIGGQSRVAIRSGGPEEAVVMGNIDADAIEAALLAHKDEFRLCYEKELNAENPNLSGRVGTSFVIGSSGRVTRAGIESTSLKNGNTESCILTVIKRIQFPIPRGAGVVQVTYPFKFSAGGR